MSDANVTKTRLIPYAKDRAPGVMAAVAPLFKLQFESFPADKQELASATLFRLWAQGDAALVVQANGDAVLGVAMLMTAATVLHDCDALVLHWQPAPGHARQLIDFLPHVATARGATGIAMNLPANPLGFEHVEELVAAGWKAKSTVFGKGL